MIDLNDFRKWYDEDPEDRNVTIAIEKNALFCQQPDGSFGYRETKVHVYSRGLGVGQLVEKVEDIDLPAELEKRQREEYEKLKKRFEQ